MRSRKIFKKSNTIWVSNSQDSILQNTYHIVVQESDAVLMLLTICLLVQVGQIFRASIGSQECCS